MVGVSDASQTTRLWSSMMMLHEAVHGDVKNSGWSAGSTGCWATKMSQPWGSHREGHREGQWQTAGGTRT